MANDTTLSPLRDLADILQGRGWRAHVSGERLKVVNPRASQLNEQVVSDGERFLWHWGHDIGPVSDPAAAADRITHVLREVEP